MEILRKLRDERYTLIEALWEGERFIYLCDREQRTESFGIVEGELPLLDIWKRHREDENYCLPCELLLHVEKKVLRGENSVAEIGLTLERLERFKKLLKEVGSEGC